MGFIAPARAGALMSDWAVAVANIKQTFTACSYAVTITYVVLSLYVAFSVVQASKMGSGASVAKAKQMLMWMIPNTMFLCLFTGFLILSIHPDLNISVVSHGNMVASSIGLNIASFGATVTQIGVFSNSSSSSSSSS